MIMIKFGRVKNGLMVNMVASNSKLKTRSTNKKLLSLDRNA